MLSIVFALGSFQALIFACLLLTKKNKINADKFLAGFFFIVALYFFIIYSYALSLWEVYPLMILIYSLVILSFGPLLYFYVLALIGRQLSKGRYFAHIIPVLITFAVIFSITFHSKEEILIFYTDKFIKLPTLVSIGVFIQYLFAPFYFVWIIVLLNKHKKVLKDNYSSIDKTNLNWMRWLLLGAITFWTIDTLNVYALNYTSLEYPYVVSLHIKFMFMLFIILIGYYGIKQGSVFTPAFLSNQIDISEKEKYVNENVPKEIIEENMEALASQMQNRKKEDELRIQDIAMNLNIPSHVLSSILNVKLKTTTNNQQNNQKTKSIPKEKIKQHVDALKAYMKKEKAYLNSELRIQDVAMELNMSLHTLSHVLNTCLNQNFYDFVNQYRLEDAKTMLMDKQFDNYSILGIAYECGFNSKASFNRIFKKHTGITPSSYKKKC